MTTSTSLGGEALLLETQVIIDRANANHRQLVANETARLQERVDQLLKQANHLHDLVAAHDFSLAAIEARGLALYLEGTNRRANRIADLEDLS